MVEPVFDYMQTQESFMDSKPEFEIAETTTYSKMFDRENNERVKNYQQ